MLGEAVSPTLLAPPPMLRAARGSAVRLPNHVEGSAAARGSRVYTPVTETLGFVHGFAPQAKSCMNPRAAV